MNVFKKISRKIVTSSIIFAILLGLVGLHVMQCQYKAPGTFMQMDGYLAHVKESGTAKKAPSVILEAGLSCFSIAWDLVEPKIAPFAHVYSYDRAGLGWSDQSPSKRTAANIVKELKELLTKLNAPKPYILVGHSFGGIIIQLYANTYPEDIYGLVLVDSSHENIKRKSEEFNKTYYHLLPGAQYYWHHTLHTIGLDYLSLLTGAQLHFFYSIMKNGKATLPATIKKSFISRLPSSAYTNMQERYCIIESHEQLAQSKNCFSDKPLIVISRGKAFDENTDPEYLQPYLTKMQEIVWHKLQENLACKSSQGKHIIAKKSCHAIIWSEPDLIVDAVKELVDQYNRSR